MRPQTITSCSTPAAAAHPGVQAAAQLWRLSRYALEHDQVRAVIESCDSWQVPIVLNATLAGRELLEGIDAYDERYRRPACNGAPIAPSWIDDPTPVVESLRDCMRRPAVDAPASLGLAA